MKTITGKKQTAIFVCVIIAALAVRLAAFGRVPGGFNQDGAMAAVDAKALAEYGTDRLGMLRPVHFTAWGFGQMSVLMSYMMVPFIRLFGLSSVTARLPCLLASLAGLAFLYLFSAECFGQKPALVIFTLGAICPWHIMQSRWALDCNLFPHFLMAGFFFLRRFAYPGSLGKRCTVALAASMVLFGLSMYCYGVSLYTVPPMLLACCIILLRRRMISVKAALGAACIYLAVAMPFLLCMAINAFGLDTVETPFFTIPFFPGSVRSSDILFFSKDFVTVLLSNARHSLEIMLQTGRDSIWNMIPGFGTLYVFSFPFAVIGFVYLVRSGGEVTGRPLVLVFFFSAVWEGLVTADVNVNRFNIVFYPLIILAGLGIWRVCLKVKLLRIPVAAAYLISFALFSYCYFTSYAAEISRSFLADFGEAVSSLKGIDAEKICITPDSQYPGSAHVSEILTLYWLDIDSEYFRGITADDGNGGPGIPYSSRFIYKRLSEDDIIPGGSCAYVISQDEVPLFDPGLFVITGYGRFATALPR